MTFRDEQDAALARFSAAMEQELSELRHVHLETVAELDRVKASLRQAHAQLEALGQPITGALAAAPQGRAMLMGAWTTFGVMALITGAAGSQSETNGVAMARWAALALGFALGVSFTQRKTLLVRFGAGLLGAVGDFHRRANILSVHVVGALALGLGACSEGADDLGEGQIALVGDLEELAAETQNTHQKRDAEHGGQRPENLRFSEAQAWAKTQQPKGRGQATEEMKHPGSARPTSTARRTMDATGR